MSLLLTGSPDETTSSSAPTIPFPNTFQGWCLPGDLITQFVIAGIFDNDAVSSGLRIGVSSTGLLMCSFRNSANSVSQVIAGALTASVFNHILMVTAANGTVTCYLNGVSQGSGSTPSDTVADFFQSSIGLRWASTTKDNYAPNNTKLAEIALHNFAFNSTQIANAAAGFAPTCFGGLLLYQNLRSALNEPGSAGTPTYGPTFNTSGTSFDGANPTIDDTCGGGGGSTGQPRLCRVRGIPGMKFTNRGGW